MCFPFFCIDFLLKGIVKILKIRYDSIYTEKEAVIC